MTSTPRLHCPQIPEGFVAYPDAEDVFGGDVAAHKLVMHPVLSLPAARVDSSWSGSLHFVLPVEPYDGALGEQAEQYYGPHCGLGWIKLVRQGSRYEFLGDFRYFAINRRPDDDDRYYYEQSAEDFRRRKRLWKSRREMEFPDFFRWTRQLGGAASLGELDGWFMTKQDVERWGRYPGRLLQEIEANNFYPLTEDGRRYRFVGLLTGHFYRAMSAGSLGLFYDQPTESLLIALGFD